MDLPEPVQQLVEHLGEAMVQALAADDQSRELARKIQAYGFEVALLVEATVALHVRDEDTEGAETEIRAHLRAESLDTEENLSQWSEEDRAFLRTFRISLD